MAKKEKADEQPLERTPVPQISAENRATVRKRIDELVAAVRKKHGPEAIARLGEFDDVLGTFPTSLPGFDRIIGHPGFPLAKLVQITGAESVGKSTLVNYLSARAQHAGIAVYFQDGEMSETKDRAAQIGIDPDLFAISEPQTLEESFLLMSTAIEVYKDRTALIILDSVASLPLQSDLDREFGEEGRRAARASFLSANLPKLVRPLKDTKIGVIFVNQVREKANAAPFEKPTYSPGGRALRHWCHLTLELTRTGQIKEKGEPVGITSRVRVEKSKIGPPLGRTVLNLYFDGRIVQGDDDD